MSFRLSPDGVLYAAVLSVLAAGVAIAFANAGGWRVTDGTAPAVMAGVVLFVLTVGLMAALGPLRRSLRIQPTEVLREH